MCQRIATATDWWLLDETSLKPFVWFDKFLTNNTLVFLITCLCIQTTSISFQPIHTWEDNRMIRLSKIMVVILHKASLRKIFTKFIYLCISFNHNLSQLSTCTIKSLLFQIQHTQSLQKVWYETSTSTPLAALIRKGVTNLIAMWFYFTSDASVTDTATCRFYNNFLPCRMVRHTATLV